MDESLGHQDDLITWQQPDIVIVTSSPRLEHWPLAQRPLALCQRI